jgi:alkylhydroperoxidase/carboxymuconolactone decarboxylase family protein YurZ
MEHSGLDDLGWAEELDPHYAALLRGFSHGGLYRRGILDERTRTLVVVGQFVAMDEMEELAGHINNALERGAAPREVLEVILQTTVYFGYAKAKRATRVFKRVLEALGRMHEIAETQLPREGPARSLEAERAHWETPQSQVSKREALLRKYGWRSLSPGLRLQPTHHIASVERMDRVDPHFNKLWLDYIYAGMYSRGILDDRTRILCIVGELFVAGEFHQAENHIRNALQHGASPREVLEVILHSTIYGGMPRFVRFVAILERALEEQGRLHEITETRLPMTGPGA